MATLSYKCKLCDFRGSPENNDLCSVCFKSYENLPPTDRLDLDTIPLKEYGATDTSNAWDEINTELAKLAPAKFMPLIQDHTARTISFPISIDEALAMHRTHHNTLQQEDPSVIDVLVKRMDEFLEENNFRDSTTGQLSAFAKLCDVSPKDVLGTNLEQLLPRAKKYADEYAHEDQTNVHLQSLIYAKCTQRPVDLHPGARGIIGLLCSSDRCTGMEGLEVKGYPSNPQLVEITLRDWNVMDPSYEFRCLINKNKVRGISQMGCMGVYDLHYPHILQAREELREGAIQFIEHIIAPKLAPLSAGLEIPGRYVLDIHYDTSNKKWTVVELNPMRTASGGHLFEKDYVQVFAAWDATDVSGLPVEFRLNDSTACNVLEQTNESWHEYLESSDDVYGGGGEDSASAGGETKTETKTTEQWTGTDGLLIIMRHSERLDDEYDMAKKDWNSIPKELWLDRLERPYDTPIVLTELPQDAAKKLLKYHIAKIVSSPFRRCLQTAGVLARELGVRQVTVKNTLGEHVPAAMKCFAKMGLEESPITLLPREEAKREVGENVELVWDEHDDAYDAYPPADGFDDVQKRASVALSELAASVAGVNVLAITHGDIVNMFLPEIVGIGIGRFKADEAGFAVTKGPFGQRISSDEQILELHRVYEM